MRTLLLLLLAPPVLFAEAPPQASVDAAIRRGVAWLRKQQDTDGSFGSQPGETALALLALRHSGVLASDRACLRAARQLSRSASDGKSYSASLGVLALLAQSPERHRAVVRKLVDALLRGQCRNGQWSYKLRRTGRRPEGDNSNTQIAALALYAARVRGVAVPRSPFALLEKHLLASQNSDGGFGYSGSAERSYASMTAGGAMMLALCRAVALGEAPHSKAVLASPALRRAHGWLARDFDVALNRGAGRARSTKRKSRNDRHWFHYWLWSLERCCGVTRTSLLGKADWYADGARLLLDAQRPEGHWRNPENHELATTFALLFLSRKAGRAVTPRERDVTITPNTGPGSSSAPKR